MGLSALVLLVVFLGVTLGLRAVIHYRLTGSAGIHRVHGRPWSVEWAAAAFLGLAAMGAFAAPVLDILGVLAPIPALDSLAARVFGLLLHASGFGMTFCAQTSMGRSWRVGVAPGESTDLVTGGLFGIVRNPIYTGMTTAAAGLALLVANAAAFGSLVSLVAAFELQVRFVEEPYLRRVHGAAFERYAAGVGRFFPMVGRLRPQDSATNIR
ncbi:MAG: isoprenylcysteine carboxylmethyltransferase family protein [Deltaproteobacteria bacterium]|nr:isoprenylcysteine carboxylmethyltransferase family protein [Deltaproteobacteria bacterium]